MKCFGLLFFCLALFSVASPAAAQQPVDMGPMVYASQEMKATVQVILEDTTVDDIRTLRFLVQTDTGEVYEVNTAQSHTEGIRYALNEGDRVIVTLIDNLDGTKTAYLTDVVRLPGILVAFLVFVAVTIAVGLRRGVLALIGFACTVGLLLFFVFPQILAGHDPVLTTMFAGVIILALNIFLSHGFTRNTAVAFVSTGVGVVMAWLFATLFVSFARLSGLTSDEAVFLYWDVGTARVPVGLLLAGIILGAVGVLDDIAITQCETVAELKAANPRLHGRDLFVRAMRVGRHHIASTVNTLILAYAGAALPLLLIFLASEEVTWLQFLNTEVVAEEIVRTLAGTTALVLTVPLATALAAAAWSHRSAEAAVYTHDEHHA